MVNILLPIYVSLDHKQSIAVWKEMLDQLISGIFLSY